jgi:D-alanyl-D-alanine dipeptidase
MPSDFDEFSERASHLYQGGDRAALARRDELRSFMEGAGFRPYDAEWWHYTDPESRAGPLIDAPLSGLGKTPRSSGQARISGAHSVES